MIPLGADDAVIRFLRILTLADYNTRVVIFGVVMLGIAGGVIGSFLLLRRRALLADAVGHAALPGVAGAFILLTILGMNARSLPLLLTGALLSGLAGMAFVLLINRFTKLSEEAALGIVLSVFFGFGIALLGIIQQMRGASAAGLGSFIYGRTASMLRADALLIGISALVIVLVAILLFKELRLYTFDQDFAAGDGWPVHKLDVLLMSLAVAVTVLGLQAVGIMLVIAILIIPPAAARFWTDRLSRMVLIAAAIGATGGYIGAGISAMAPRLPAGAVIVCVMGGLFVLSLIFGSTHGLVPRALDELRLRKQNRRHHILRCFYECGEAVDNHEQPLPFELVSKARAWNSGEFKRALSEARRADLVDRTQDGELVLTEKGQIAAQRITRNHRLWEIYLLEHADVAAAHVDQGADFIEHVLGNELVAELESSLRIQGHIPDSVHELAAESPIGAQGATRWEADR